MAFVKFLKPRIDSAAELLLKCMDMKDELKDLIDENFSQWTDCINEKSALLAQMYANPEEVQEGEEFLDFLTRIRGEYDALKDEDMVYIIEPMIEVPEVDEECPDDVHQQQSVAEQF